MMYEVYNQLNPEAPNELEWYWRLIKVAGNIPIAYSARSFKTKKECEANIQLVMMADYTTPVILMHHSPSSETIKLFSQLHKRVDRFKTDTSQ